MKFREFKEICLKHKQIQKEQGNIEADKYFKSCGISDSYDILKKFTIPFCDFETTLINFFNKENKQVEIEIYENTTGGESATIYVEDIEKYELGLYPFSTERMITLEEMYCYDNGDKDSIIYKSGINNLLVDFPNFEEVLWLLMEEKNREPKREQERTIIQGMLEKQKDIDFLTNPKLIEEKVEELTMSKAKDNEELRQVWASMNDVEI